MAYGAPVVSSNATCLPEIYGQAAHYFDPLDARAMADAINEVVTDADLRQKLIALGGDKSRSTPGIIWLNRRWKYTTRRLEIPGSCSQP
jgi:glycosyltransferase involved in cell wall biosynthesis